MDDLSFTGGVADRYLLSRIEGQHYAEQIFRHEEIKRCLKDVYEGCDATVALEPHAIGKKQGRKCLNRSDRADLLVEGDASDGKKAIDVTVQLVSGAAVINQAASTNIFAPEKLLKDARARIKTKLNARHKHKIQESRSVNYGGTFWPMVITAGGTLHAGAERIFDSIRDYSPREAI